MPPPLRGVGGLMPSGAVMMPPHPHPSPLSHPSPLPPAVMPFFQNGGLPVPLPGPHVNNISPNISPNVHVNVNLNVTLSAGAQPFVPSAKARGGKPN